MGGEGLASDRVEIEALGPAADGVEQLVGLGGGEDEDHVLWWLLQSLEQGISGRLGEHVSLVQDVDPTRVEPGGDRRDGETHLPDVLDRVVRGGVEFHDVERGAFGDPHTGQALVVGGAVSAPFLAVESLGQDPSGGGFSRSAGAGEEVGVGNSAFDHLPRQGGGDVSLSRRRPPTIAADTSGREPGRTSVAAYAIGGTSPRGPEPSNVSPANADTDRVTLMSSALFNAVPTEDTTTPPAVWSRGLVRRFGKEVAVDGIDLSIHPGEFYGLLGQNGAGKTTTIKMIVGLLRPNAGTAGIGSYDTWKEPIEVKKRIGVLPEEFNLYERLTGAELLDFTAAMHGLEREETVSRRNELLGLLDLTDAAGKLVGDYSRGMRKKVALAAAIIHRPPVLFLDEPFEGVDPVSARLIQDLLRRYTAQGATIVFSSHEMYLVERLCTRIGIMQKGKLLLEDTPAGLVERMGVETVEDAFIMAVGGETTTEGLGWLHNSVG